MIINSKEKFIEVAVAVFAPVNRTFNYLVKKNEREKKNLIGVRVLVPFGKTSRLGIIVDEGCKSDPKIKLKKIISCFEADLPLASDNLKLARWVSNYYKYPLGEILALFFTSALRTGKDVKKNVSLSWRFAYDESRTGKNVSIKGVRQKQIVKLLREQNHVDDYYLNSLKLNFNWRKVMNGLESKGLVTVTEQVGKKKVRHFPNNKIIDIQLNSHQKNAVLSIESDYGNYNAFLLYGVTGSGKTEVYMELIKNVNDKGEQALLLVPEITLTEQIVSRFKDRFKGMVGVLHSQCKEREKLETWERARTGEVPIIIGTRSAIWTPIQNLGVIVVDEEHDLSYKQQDGLLYSARDVAIKRGQIENCPVILGTATPSVETIVNVKNKKYKKIAMETRVKGSSLPELKILDMNFEVSKQGLSFFLINKMREQLSQGYQVILFLNRRGFAPACFCKSCKKTFDCDQCDRPYVFHRAPNIFICHHCGKQAPISAASQCCDNSDTIMLGFGTEKIEETVRQIFPQKKVMRIDRDTIKNISDIRDVFVKIETKQIDILVGTQMISKGLDFSGINLIGIIDADSRLCSVDYKSEERFAQLITQIAGRSGRSESNSSVLIQTHMPEHPVLRRIVEGGYDTYLVNAVSERKKMRIPPFSKIVVIRSECRVESTNKRFLDRVRKIVLKYDSGCDINVSYPIPAYYQRKAGRFRTLLVLEAPDRKKMNTLLDQTYLLVEKAAKSFSSLRWTLDVDPEDLC